MIDCYPIRRNLPDRGRIPTLWDDESGWLTVRPEPDCVLCQDGICLQRVRVDMLHEVRVMHSMGGKA